jgi:hypothetical protein
VHQDASRLLQTYEKLHAAGVVACRSTCSRPYQKFRIGFLLQPCLDGVKKGEKGEKCTVARFGFIWQKKCLIMDYFGSKDSSRDFTP